MLNPFTAKVLEQYQAAGWVPEPAAKSIMKTHGLPVPDSILTADAREACDFLKASGSAVVAKAVSEKVVHKTELNAVALGIETPDQLTAQMERLMAIDGCEAVLVEKMVSGIELIVGGVMDHAFGPVVLLGLGGTAVEVFQDTAVRMAPLKTSDVWSMVLSLKAGKLILGHRGKPGVNMDLLSGLMIGFSQLLSSLEDRVTSIDLNPVICSQDHCMVADARIILPPSA